MRGHIIKRYKNSYTIVLNSGNDPSTGKRKQQWISVKGTKKEAEKKLAELLHQLDTGTYMKPGKTTLAEFLQYWLKDYVTPNLGPRTKEGYESIVRSHLVPFLGKIFLTQLKPEHLQQYYADQFTKGRIGKDTGLSARTVRSHHMVLHKALECAVRWGLIMRNLADAVAPPRAQRAEMHIWGEDEIIRFLEAAKKTEYYPIFHLALFTGMRRSEFMALRWQDIDFIFNQIHVSRSVHQLHNGSLVYRQPKSAKGQRSIALSPDAALVLKEHRNRQAMNRAVLGSVLKDEDLIFSHQDGSPMLPDTISHAWTKLVKRTGLSRIRLHDARHSHASLMLKQGIHPKIVQERLGHASVQTTLDLYSHVVPGLQEAAAIRFDELLKTKREKQVIENIS